ncbi:MAG: hypothetical protein JWR20_634 [Marmoricola sp.]|nr:hypothetical protein [Marmoricola sp.]
MTTNDPHDLGAVPGQVPGTPTTYTSPTTSGTTSTSGSSGAGEKAQQAAGTAKQEAGHVAGVAQQEAGKVAAEAKDQLRGLVDDATSQVDQQTRAQKSRLTETLRTFGDDLDGMAQQQEGSGPARQLVQQVSEQARTLASHLDDREPQELLEDVRRFARRRPGAFLLGAVAAGVVAGRLTRGAKAAKDGGTSGAAGTGQVRPPVTTAPRTVGTVGPGTAGGLAPEPTESFDQPGPGRDVLVDPLDPIDPVGTTDDPGFRTPSAGGPA